MTKMTKMTKLEKGIENLRNYIKENGNIKEKGNYIFTCLIEDITGIKFNDNEIEDFLEDNFRIIEIGEGQNYTFEIANKNINKTIADNVINSALEWIDLLDGIVLTEKYPGRDFIKGLIPEKDLNTISEKDFNEIVHIVCNSEKLKISEQVQTKNGFKEILVRGEF